MVDYPFSKVEVRLSNGDTIKGMYNERLKEIAEGSSLSGGGPMLEEVSE